jgi:hypothetical protein
MLQHTGFVCDERSAGEREATQVAFVWVARGFSLRAIIATRVSLRYNKQRVTVDATRKDRA